MTGNERGRRRKRSERKGSRERLRPPPPPLPPCLNGGLNSFSSRFTTESLFLQKVQDRLKVSLSWKVIPIFPTALRFIAITFFISQKVCIPAASD